MSNFVVREPRARGFFRSDFSHTIGSLGFTRLSPHGRAITRLVRFCGVTLGLGLAVLSTRMLSAVETAQAERVAEILPFKSSLFEAAVRAALPVASVTLHYQIPSGVPPASLAVCWWGDMTFARHFYQLLQLPQFEATLVFGSEVLSGSHRKILARQAHASVVQHFQPLLCPLP